MAGEDPTCYHQVCIQDSSNSNLTGKVRPESMPSESNRISFRIGILRGVNRH